MKNITLSVDDKVLAAVRRYAAENNTTVNRLVREYLSGIATQEDRAAKARQKLLELSERSRGDLGAWKWNREEIYEDRLLPRHEHPDIRGFGEEGRGIQKDEGE